MAINNKTELTVLEYSRSQRPVVNNDMSKYLLDELQRLQNSINSLTNAAIQVADREPENPQKGMVRYNKSPWDALGNSSEGLVVYDGTNWAAI